MVASVTWTKNGPQVYNVLITLGFDLTHSVSVDVANNVRGLIPPAQRDDPAVISSTASDWVQMLIDAGYNGQPGRVTLASIAGEPDAITDPHRPDYFHARVASILGQGGSAVPIYRPVALVGGTPTHLISRPFLARVVWDGTNFDIQTETPPLALR